MARGHALSGAKNVAAGWVADHDADVEHSERGLDEILPLRVAPAGRILRDLALGGTH